MEYKGHFTITKKDNIDFNFLLLKNRLIKSSIVVFAVVLVLVGLFNYAMKGMSIPEALLQGFLMGLLGMVLMFAFNIAMMYLRIGGMYRQNKIQDFTFDMVMDKEGFHAKSERGDVDIPWNRIQSVQETKKAFYIFIAQNNANVLPKAQQNLPTDAELVRKLARKYLPEHQCKLKA